MNKAPILDPRKKQDIIREILEKAKAYTPEWRFEPDDLDAGGAIADIFAGMFYETVDRFNRVPYRNYIEFLNMLNVSKNPATPARGYVKFDVNTPDERGVHIKKGTQMYADDPDGQGRDIVFETERSFYATPAKIDQILLVDAKKDIIEPADFADGPVAFFGANPEKNVQRHEVYIGHDDVLSVRQPCVVEIRPLLSVGMMADKVIGRLTDPKFARWEYFDGENWSPFDEVRAENETVIAVKRSDRPVCRQDDENPYWIRCAMSGGEDRSDILVQGVDLRTSLIGEWAGPDEVFFNDMPIDMALGGYCFGRQPVPYDCFYIASGELFGKRGAQVSLTFQMRTIVDRQITPDKMYEFNKLIIDKNDKVIKVDEIYISEITWEYWNGSGWRPLKVSGDVNPFSCRREGQMALTFVCPADIQKVEVSAHENFWIRARVAFVENNFSLTGDRLLPFVKDLKVTYKYGAMLPAQYIRTRNNGETFRISNADRLQQDIVVYKALPPEPPCVYIRFDKPVRGYPVNLYFKLAGQFEEERDVEFQVLTRTGFKKIKTQNSTDGFSGSGIVSLFLNEGMESAALFGVEGYWLRLVDNGQRRQEKPPLPVEGIEMNVVDVVQQRREEELRFASDIYEANRVLRLANTPVQSCEVWVDELPDISEAEKTELMQNSPDIVRITRDKKENITAFQVLWTRVDSFDASGPASRHYILDPIDGTITFGDGRRGKVPSVGENSITVRYTSGGGARGNLPAGAIHALVHSVAFVTGIRNIAPTCGGSDVQSLELVERLGPLRIKHRYRAVCPEDYEAIVRERFNEVLDVKCFPHLDASGNKSHGAVTVVVMARNYDNRDYSRHLCQRIKNALSECCDCMVLAEGKLSVIPATVVTVNVTVTVALDSEDFAAEAERGVLDAIAEIIQPTAEGRLRPIGSIPTTLDFYRALKYVDHVTAVRDVMIEGSYFERGRHRLINLDGKTPLPFAVVLSGTHTVKI